MSNQQSDFKFMASIDSECMSDADWPKAVERVLAWWHECSEMVEPEEAWSNVESIARNVVTAHENDDWFWPSLDRKGAVTDARCFLSFLDYARNDCMSPGDALVCGYYMGLLGQWVMYRWFTKDVITGYKVVRGGKKGLEKGHGSDEEREARNRQIRHCFERLRRDGLAIELALKRTATEFHRSPRQIRRILKKFEP